VVGGRSDPVGANLEGPVGSLHGRVAIVTGAAAGIGRHYATALAEAGAAVAAADVDGEAVSETAEQIVRSGGDALGMLTDVRLRDSVDDMVRATMGRWGGVDILVANAGLHLSRYAVPCSQIDEDRWQDLLDVNVTGTLRCVQACLPAMRDRGGGSIVIQSSASAFRLGSAYSVSKLTLVGLTTALAGELGDDGIRVNAIAPGLVDSPAAFREVSEERRARLVAEQKLRRPGTMDDLVGTLLYLVGEASSFVTGQTILVDGGLATRI
jgi:NAD(P)-dependent dehydrogenase (short-subunit alcohol dehydrogenase family)